MPTSDSPLSNRRKRVREQLLAQLLSGCTVEFASKAVGCSESTAYRIIRTPAAQQEFRKLQKAVLDRATSKLIDSLDESIDGLRQLSRDAAQPGSSRVSAFLGLIKQAYERSSLSEIEQRISILEEQRKGNSNPEE